jgi:diguanylate cyclase (GGDEF)-like protein
LFESLCIGKLAKTFFQIFARRTNGISGEISIMNTDNHQMNLSIDTIFYGPTYQFVLRILLSALTLVYFIFLPIPLFIFNLYFVYISFIIFIIFHIIWWIQFRKKGISNQKIRLANWVDLITAGTAVIIDPNTIPPTMVLILTAVMGNGIQHGLQNFIIVSKNAIYVCLISLPLHFLVCQQWPPYSFYFLFLYLISCGHYSSFLFKRIELMKKNAEEQAQRDELTGLINRRAFLKSAQYLVSLHNRTKLPLVFIFADLDGFKKINDSLGHAVGDQVLKIFGEISAQNFRETDIVARYGGDEFVFILANSTLQSAKTVFHRLETQFLEWAATLNIHVGVSYGIRVVENEEANLEDIMKDVDDALYAEKKVKARAI